MAPSDSIPSASSSSLSGGVIDERRRAGETAGSGFDALLQSTQQSMRVRAMTEVRSAPTQMFEAEDGHARRARSDEGPQRGASRADAPTDVQVASAVSVAQPITGSAGLTNATAGSKSNPPSGSGASSREAARDSAAPPQARVGDPESPSVVENSTGKASGVSSSFSTSPAPQPAPVVARVQATSQVTAPTPVVSPVGRGAESEAVAPARQIGEILAGTRGGPSASGPPSPHAAKESTAKASNPSAATDKPQAPTPPSDADASPFERLVRSMRLQIGEKVSTARLQLHPPELGRMRVEVRVEGSRVEVDVHTENQAAQGIIAGRAEELRTALQQHGIDVQRFDVVFDPRPAGQARTDEDRPRQRRGDREELGDGRTLGEVFARRVRSRSDLRLDVRI